jgi:hypothetical protein
MRSAPPIFQNFHQIMNETNDHQAVAQSPLNRRAMVPLRLTVQEFSKITRVCRETVRRDIRAGIIEAKGPPHLINRRELQKYGIDWTEVTEADFPSPSPTLRSD